MKVLQIVILLSLSSFSMAEEFHEALDCLVSNMLFEARSEGKMGMAAVANVTTNRVKSVRFPNTYCEVVKQRKQFSWTVQSVRERMIEINPNVESWVIHQARVLAAKSIIGELTDYTEGATHYHTRSITPYWASSMVKIKSIGQHTFYYKPNRPSLRYGYGGT